MKLDIGKLIEMLVKILKELLPKLAGLKGIFSGITGKLLPIFSKLNSSFPVIGNTIEKVKEKLIAFFKDRDLKSVLRNPWVIANGVILIIALSMTAVMVSWFKTKHKTLDTALVALDQAQSKLETEIKKEITFEPFVLKEQSYDKKQIDEVIDKLKQEDDEKIQTLLESADKLFNEGEYEKALAFYGSLAKDGGATQNNDFIKLRLGMCFYHLGLYVDANEAFSELFVDSKSKEIKWQSGYFIGECYMAAGDYVKGRESFYTLIAMSGKIPLGMSDLIERSYFRIANSYIEETQEQANKRQPRMNTNTVFN